MRRVLKPGGRIALMTSVRRKVTLPPLKPVMERASGMRMFESDEIVRALPSADSRTSASGSPGWCSSSAGASRGPEPHAVSSPYTAGARRPRQRSVP